MLYVDGTCSDEHNQSLYIKFNFLQVILGRLPLNLKPLSRQIELGLNYSELISYGLRSHSFLFSETQTVRF